ncbi:unnamed protein product [Rangifer tarandus platyrhynchus]|uniref:Uncharacterized protein n=1 Tax=Rangifer tarandus platyrhynchus TaxID=3082113 RepID=A0AC59YIG6_RANTA
MGHAHRRPRVTAPSGAAAPTYPQRQEGQGRSLSQQLLHRNPVPTPVSTSEGEHPAAETTFPSPGPGALRRVWLSAPVSGLLVWNTCPPFRHLAQVNGHFLEEAFRDGQGKPSRSFLPVP